MFSVCDWTTDTVVTVHMNTISPPQMMYDTSNGGERFRMFNSAGLAWWHTYKHGVIEIWKVFAPMIWGPLYHELYPNSQFFVDGSPLPNMVTHLTYMRLAYTGVRAQMEVALERDDLTNRSRTALEDIRFMCEFAIPVVHTHTQSPLILTALDHSHSHTPQSARTMDIQHVGRTCCR
jgi:hypothetical protein